MDAIKSTYSDHSHILFLNHRRASNTAFQSLCQVRGQGSLGTQLDVCMLPVVDHIRGGTEVEPVGMGGTRPEV